MSWSKLFKASFFLLLIIGLISLTTASHGNGHPECTNGVDDDGDGLVDENDPGCETPYSLDDNEGNSYDTDASWS